jgi:sugar lactone lactonase YvrE
MNRRRVLGLFGIVVLSAASPWGDGSARAEYILAARYFTGGIDIYDPLANSVRNFITIPQSTDSFPGLTGLVYSPSLNRLYATANTSQRIYAFNAESGGLIGFHQLSVSGSFAPAGIALDPSGDLSVSDNSGATVVRFTPNATDASLTASGTITFTAPAGNLNGVARTASGDLLVSAINGSGVHRSSDGTQSPFNASPFANGQIAISAAGSVAVGGVVFSSRVSLFDLLGDPTGFIDVNAGLLPQPPLSYVSADVTSPQGVAFDGSGNLIVTAMGRTNPFSPDDNFQSNGGIFVFDSTGTMLLNSLVNTTPYTGVIVAPVPEPNGILLLAVATASLAGLRRLRRPSRP